MSKKRIKEMGKRAREKKAADIAKQYYQNSALAQAAARSLASRPIEAPNFRQVVDIETHGAARFFVQHPDGTTHPLRNVPPDLAEREFRQRSSALRDQIEAALWGGMGDVLPPMGQPDNQVGTAGLSSRSVDGFTDSANPRFAYLSGSLGAYTAQEQVEALLESPDVPDCVRWNFVAGALEELALHRWDRGREPSERTLEAIEACRELAGGRSEGKVRGLVSLFSGYNIKETVLNVSRGYSSYVPFHQVELVPYEWQLAHLRDLIAEHNKHRLPLLLCLKERAQRIKQAPSYGQQLEGVLYAS